MCCWKKQYVLRPSMWGGARASVFIYSLVSCKCSLAFSRIWWALSYSYTRCHNNNAIFSFDHQRAVSLLFPGVARLCDWLLARSVWETRSNVRNVIVWRLSHIDMSISSYSAWLCTHLRDYLLVSTEVIVLCACSARLLGSSPQLSTQSESLLSSCTTGNH